MVFDAAAQPNGHMLCKIHLDMPIPIIYSNTRVIESYYCTMVKQAQSDFPYVTMYSKAVSEVMGL